MPASPALSLPSLLSELLPVAREAGTAILALYADQAACSRRDKHDRSPVTLADEQAEALIEAALARLTPRVPVIGEEAAARGEAPDACERFWLVDPLDGTREFLQGIPEFTVNIALIERGRPRLGIVLAPALGSQGHLYYGAAGLGAWSEQDGARRPVHCRPAPAEGLTVVASRSHADAGALGDFLAPYRVAARRDAGSSLKFCLVAAGEADLYPRLGRTMEWDTAAGQAVIEAAGGSVTTLGGVALEYGKAGLENPSFVARGAAQSLADGALIPDPAPA